MFDVGLLNLKLQILQKGVRPKALSAFAILAPIHINNVGSKIHMKTYPIIGESQQMHAFEIDNWKLGRRRAAQIVSLIPGAVVLRQPKRLLSWFREDVFCEFQVNGVVFEIEEPYGDSSRYWIGKQPDGGWCPELDVVEETFRNA